MSIYDGKYVRMNGALEGLVVMSAYDQGGFVFFVMMNDGKLKHVHLMDGHTIEAIEPPRGQYHHNNSEVDPLSVSDFDPSSEEKWISKSFREQVNELRERIRSNAPPGMTHFRMVNQDISCIDAADGVTMSMRVEYSVFAVLMPDGGWCPL